MERLTHRGTKGEIWIVDNDYTRLNGRMSSAYHKLADYEDMEEGGMLLKLPCRPGTVVYCIADDCIYGGECHEKRNCDGCECRNLYIEQEIFSLSGIILHLNDFGKTIFLTPEEADKRLAEIKALEAGKN